MVTKQWKPIKINNEFNIFKLIKDQNDNLIFWLSDFKYVWREEISMSNILDRSKSENPLIECDKSIIIKTIMNSPLSIQLINKPETNDQGQLQMVSTNIKLTMKYYIDGKTPYQYYWQLKLCEQNTFFDEITRPTLVSLMGIQQKYQQLLNIVKKKDIEIEQYKSEGATLIRKHIATQLFIPNEFERQFYLTETIDDSFVHLSDSKSEYFGEMKTLCRVNNLERPLEDHKDLEIDESGNMEDKLKTKKISPIKYHGNARGKVAMRKFKSTKMDTKIIYNNKKDGNESESSTDNEEMFANNKTNDMPIIKLPDSTIIIPQKRAIDKDEIEIAVVKQNVDDSNATAIAVAKPANIHSPNKRIKLKTKLNL